LGFDGGAGASVPEIVNITVRTPYPGWKFNQVYNADRQYSEHQREARYLLPPPADKPTAPPDRRQLYIHVPARRRPPA
jgi:hypothetical protein